MKKRDKAPNITKATREKPCRRHLSDHDCQDDDSENYSQNKKKTDGGRPGSLLMATGSSQFHIRATSALINILNVVADYVQLASLLRHYMSHISKKFVQLSHGLFDIPDLSLSFNNQGFLEIDLALVSELGSLLQLLLPLKLNIGIIMCVLAIFNSGTCCHCRCSLFLQCATLNGLEFI